MRRALLSVMAIGIVVMLAGAGALAYFSDTESSTGNTFTAGTMDLKIKDGDQDWSDGIGAEWTMTDMKPGDSDYGSVDLKNAGSIPADHLEITCDYTIDDPTGPESDEQEDTSADHMADYMIITKLDYSYPNGNNSTGTENLLPKLNDKDGDGKDLLELKKQGIDDVTPAPDGHNTIDMTIKFSEDAGNDFQDDTLTVTFKFAIAQVSGQDVIV